MLRAEGWTVETALVGLAGVALAFGMWWMYFVIPSGELLHHHRNRSFGWGYGHLPLFASIAATGVGLHVAALHIEHASTHQRARRRADDSGTGRGVRAVPLRPVHAC